MIDGTNYRRTAGDRRCFSINIAYIDFLRVFAKKLIYCLSTETRHESSIDCPDRFQLNSADTHTQKKTQLSFAENIRSEPIYHNSIIGIRLECVQWAEWGMRSSRFSKTFSTKSPATNAQCAITVLGSRVRRVAALSHCSACSCALAEIRMQISQ